MTKESVCALVVSLVALASLAEAWRAARERQGFDDLAAPAPEVALVPERLEGIESYACAACHAEVVEEWAATAHGVAWVDEVYQEALARRSRPELCYGCHVPEPLLATGALPRRPRARDEHHRGVDCESCHAGPDGAMLGPRGTATAAHPSAASELMSGGGSSALCAACHATSIGPVIGIAKDFLAADLARRGRSCVGCHMAPVERSWAEVDGRRSPARTGRSHALQTPRDPSFLRRAFHLSAAREAGGVRVSVANAAGHRVPGLIGREIRLSFELVDAAGVVIGRGELVVDATVYLPLGAERQLMLAGAGERVLVRGLHVDPRQAEPVLFLERALPVE